MSTKVLKTFSQHLHQHLISPAVHSHVIANDVHWWLWKLLASPDDSMQSFALAWYTTSPNNRGMHSIMNCVDYHYMILFSPEGIDWSVFCRHIYIKTTLNDSDQDRTPNHPPSSLSCLIYLQQDFHLFGKVTPLMFPNTPTLPAIN